MGFGSPDVEIEVTIQSRVERIQSRIAAAAQRGGRDAKEISLIAAVKGIDSERVREALSCEIAIIGENRVQEAQKRYTEIADIEKSVGWHMIGHLQRNKVKKAVEIFDMIQSVDSLSLAEEVSQKALAKGRKVDILVEINTSEEKTKFGIPPDPEIVTAFVGTLENLKGVQFLGLMTIGPFFQDPEGVRPAFRNLRVLRDQLQEQGIRAPILSMGMTHDFEVAVEEGSSMVRIGTGIFGERAR